jgi:hypothetical protein
MAKNKPNKKKNKKSALAAAASKRLGGGQPKYTPEQIAHFMLHAEERGEAERVPLEDGSWGWMMKDPKGQAQILKPTPAMLAALEKFSKEGHPAHDHDDEESA